jgi:hypothetical protein
LQDAEKVHQQRSRIAQRLNVRHGVRFASSLVAALLDSLFAHPAWRFSVVSTLDIRDGYRGQNEFFSSLLERFDWPTRDRAEIEALFSESSYRMQVFHSRPAVSATRQNKARLLF